MSFYGVCRLKSSIGWVVAFILLVGFFAPRVATAKNPPLAYISVGEYGMEWNPSEVYPILTLRVSGPDGEVFEGSFNGADRLPYFDFYTGDGDLRPNGQYQYELIAYPKIDKKTLAMLTLARESEERDAIVRKFQAAGKLPKDTISQSGNFQFEGGTASFVEPHTVTTIAVSDTDEPKVTKDQVIPDDLITQGSICVGVDCINDENFGFDTLRLKENNLQIHFDDTSNSASFPANDWRIVANDSSNGGANYLGFQDATADRMLFRVTASAPSNSFFMDSSGRIGFRTSTPVLDLHVSTGNTPALRLEQTGGSGFTPQTWDVAGNEANFFIRDVNGGSLLPFRIRPGAPTSSLDLLSTALVINENGNNYDTRIESDNDPNMFFVDASADKIGVGLANPTQTFQVEKSNGGGNTTIWVKNTSNTANSNSRFYTQVAGQAAGDPKFSMAIQGGTVWEFGLHNSDSDKFKISRGNDLAGNNYFTISTAGNVGINNSNPGALLAVGNGGAVCNGTTWIDGSSRDFKKNIESLTDHDLRNLMEVLDEVKMVSFQYQQEPDTAPERVGVIAEELPDALASADRKGLELGRNVGFLLGVVKALKAENEKNSEMIAELRAEIEALKNSR